MLKDPEPEPLVQAEEKSDDLTPELIELDPSTSLPERFVSWVDMIDR